MAVVHIRDLSDEDIAHLGIQPEPTEVQRFGVCPICGCRMAKESDGDRCYRDTYYTDKLGNVRGGSVRCIQDAEDAD